VENLNLMKVINLLIITKELMYHLLKYQIQIIKINYLYNLHTFIMMILIMVILIK